MIRIWLTIDWLSNPVTLRATNFLSVRSQQSHTVEKWPQPSFLNKRKEYHKVVLMPIRVRLSFWLSGSYTKFYTYWTIRREKLLIHKQWQFPSLASKVSIIFNKVFLLNLLNSNRIRSNDADPTGSGSKSTTLHTSPWQVIIFTVAWLKFHFYSFGWCWAQKLFLIQDVSLKITRSGTVFT